MQKVSQKKKKKSRGVVTIYATPSQGAPIDESWSSLEYLLRNKLYIFEKKRIVP